MVVASGPRFLRVVVRNGRTFLLDGGCPEAGKLDLFFKRTLRGFGVVDVLMLVLILRVLKAKQGIEAGQEFLKELCA
ncbi:MAG: hypothetical protein JW395_1289 [Nitrospira sp.]|nr:hypothetical protein [Nitrospira sp.]